MLRCRSKHSYVARRETTCGNGKRSDERSPERRKLDFKLIARLDTNAIRKAQRGRAEEMHVHVSRHAMSGIFEMVELEIGERVAHVLLAREKRLFPPYGSSAPNAAAALEVRGQRSGAQLRADAALAQLRVSEIEVIAAFGDVVGELIADCEAQPYRASLRCNDVQA